MYRRGSLAICILSLLGFILAFTSCRDGNAAPARSRTTSSATDQSQDLRAWVDPDTGLLGIPPDGAFTEEAGGSASEPAALQLVPGRTSAGGMMVDLRGRFGYSRRASVQSGGVVAHCDLHDEADGGK